jgi:predicted membrane-bound mannosyltransferase
VFFGLSVAGEKMPWLEVHIALPLAMLAALTVNDLVTAFSATRTRRGPNVGGAPRRSWVTWSPLTVAGAAGLTAAAVLLLPGDVDRRAPFLIACLVVAGVAGLAGAIRVRSAGSLAVAVAVIAMLLPLTVRDAVRAAFVSSDTPRELLVYTQTSPQLKQISERLDQLARDSGLGYEMPIMVDTSHAFTWPWAWYLRDYRNVRYIDLETYPAGQLSSLQPGKVLLTSSLNTRAADAWSGYYAPGERYAHRWWFPEDGYRATTALRFWDWLRDPDGLRTWREFLLHRTLPEPIGSIDGVAFFAADSPNAGLE